MFAHPVELLVSNFILRFFALLHLAWIALNDSIKSFSVSLLSFLRNRLEFLPSVSTSRC